MESTRDSNYLDILLDPVRSSKEYKPKFGRNKAFSLSEFQQLYGQDPFYRWLGLDNDLLYAAHKAAGGMTSVYRQIGIGCERLFRRILQDQLGLGDADVIWSYSVRTEGGGTRTLSLDGRIRPQDIKEKKVRDRISVWMEDAAAYVGVDKKIAASLNGVVFEVRQGYKSKDSKRQNADISNASNAYASGYLPCAYILSTQIDEDISLRYRQRKWLVLTGTVGAGASPLESSYAFMNDVVGFNLSDFFERHSKHLREEIEKILVTLLSPE